MIPMNPTPAAGRGKVAAPSYSEILGLTTAQLVSHADDTAYTGYILAGQTVIQNAASQWTATMPSTGSATAKSANGARKSPSPSAAKVTGSIPKPHRRASSPKGSGEIVFPRADPAFTAHPASCAHSPDSHLRLKSSRNAPMEIPRHPPVPAIRLARADSTPQTRANTRRMALSAIPAIRPGKSSSRIIGS